MFHSSYVSVAWNCQTHFACFFEVYYTEFIDLASNVLQTLLNKIYVPVCFNNVSASTLQTDTGSWCTSKWWQTETEYTPKNKNLHPSACLVSSSVSCPGTCPLSSGRLEIWFTISKRQISAATQPRSQKYVVDGISHYWFKPYLDCRKQRCFVNGSLSICQPITCGFLREQY